MSPMHAASFLHLSGDRFQLPWKQLMRKSHSIRDVSRKKATAAKKHFRVYKEKVLFHQIWSTVGHEAMISLA
jgi:hypothetical protein